jgi:ABC-2 type transport system permease protein
VLTSILIALSAVVSLIAIVSIYREGGILKRLRATPLPPIVILTAHVLVKLIFTAITLAAMLLAGRRYFPPDVQIPVLSFGAALIFTTWAILSIGFVIASVVPTARFAQPLATMIVYPMLGLSGLFYPIERMPATLQMIARASPLTYAVSLLDGIWKGESWLAHGTDVAALVLTFIVCTAISVKVFRWE